MRKRFIGWVACLILSGVALAADAPEMAPIRKFIDSFNKGDVATAAATHAAVDELVIISVIGKRLAQ